MNIGCSIEHLFEEDLIYLIAYWRTKDKFCDNVKKLTLDNDFEFIVFQGCTLQSIKTIFEQSPYLTLVPNEEEMEFIHSGESLDIDFLFQINWTYEL